MTTPFDPGTWTCHVCGDERPDAQISVFSRDIDLGAGVVMTENIRYCNDRPECREGAQVKTWIKKEEVKGPPYVVGITQSCQDGQHEKCRAGPEHTVRTTSINRPGKCRCSCHTRREDEDG